MAEISFTTTAPETNDSELATLQKVLAAIRGVGSASGLLSASTVRQSVLDKLGRPINAQYSTGSASFTTRTKHYVRATASGFRLVWSGKYASGGSTPEATLPNSVTIKAGVETSAGSIIPVTFNGALSGTLSDGATLVSDVISASVVSGDYVWLRVFQDRGASTYKFSNFTLKGTTNATGEGYIDATDYAHSGTISQADYVGLLPIVATADVSVKDTNAILVVGDSISVGSGDFDEAGGFLTRALAPYFPIVKLGVGGETAANFATALQRAYRLAAAQQGRYRVAICEYGTNDWAGGSSAATIQANLTAIHTLLSAMGCRVYQTTISPRPTSSSNNWTTVAGQTAAATDSVRTTVNTWIRTLPSPLSGYLEVADAVESARDSGKWYCPAASSYSGTSAGTTSGTTVTPSGSPGWTTNQWTGYTVRNATAGTVGHIRSNTSGVLTLDSSMSFTAGDTVEIWGSYTRDGIHPSTVGHLAIAQRTALAVL